MYYRVTNSHSCVYSLSGPCLRPGLRTIFTRINSYRVTTIGGESKLNSLFTSLRTLRDLFLICVLFTRFFTTTTTTSPKALPPRTGSGQ